MTQVNGKKEKTNGKATEEKANGKVAQEEKIIPQDAWKKFAEYWDKCEWSELTIAEIKKHLGNGKYVFVQIPANITDKIIGTAWFNMMKSFKEKKASFGGYTVCFAGKTDTLEKIFGDKPLTTTEMTKRLYFYINDHKLSSKNSEPKVEEKNGKKTVKVTSVADMEKAVEKITKKGKK